MNKIHPERFSPMQIAEDPILAFFHYTHMPTALQSVCKPFCDLAEHIVTTLPRSEERGVALHKLFEVKAAFVRANVHIPEVKPRKTSTVAFGEIGEPREIGGHDPDRDGPVPFSN